MKNVMMNQVLWDVVLFFRGNTYWRLEGIKILRNVCACLPGDKKQNATRIESLATLLSGYKIWENLYLEHKNPTA